MNMIDYKSLVHYNADVASDGAGKMIIMMCHLFLKSNFQPTKNNQLPHLSFKLNKTKKSKVISFVYGNKVFKTTHHVSKDGKYNMYMTVNAIIHRFPYDIENHLDDTDQLKEEMTYTMFQQDLGRLEIGITTNAYQQQIDSLAENIYPAYEQQQQAVQRIQTTTCQNYLAFDSAHSALYTNGYGACNNNTPEQAPVATYLQQNGHNNRNLRVYQDTRATLNKSYSSTTMGSHGYTNSGITGTYLYGNNALNANELHAFNSGSQNHY